jgi:hypothetical protein
VSSTISERPVRIVAHEIGTLCLGSNSCQQVPTFRDNLARKKTDAISGT